MIQNDLIKWIVQVLKNEKDTLTEYSYEYATALFMNLSLRTEGKKKCEELDVNYDFISFIFKFRSKFVHN